MKCARMVGSSCCFLCLCLQISILTSRLWSSFLCTCLRALSSVSSTAKFICFKSLCNHPLPLQPQPLLAPICVSSLVFIVAATCACIDPIYRLLLSSCFLSLTPAPCPPLVFVIHSRAALHPPSILRPSTFKIPTVLTPNRFCFHPHLLFLSPLLSSSSFVSQKLHSLPPIY